MSKNNKTKNSLKDLLMHKKMDDEEDTTSDSSNNSSSSGGGGKGDDASQEDEEKSLIHSDPEINTKLHEFITDAHPHTSPEELNKARTAEIITKSLKLSRMTTYTKEALAIEDLGKIHAFANNFTSASGQFRSNNQKTLVNERLNKIRTFANNLTNLAIRFSIDKLHRLHKATGLGGVDNDLKPLTDHSITGKHDLALGSNANDLIVQKVGDKEPKTINMKAIYELNMIKPERILVHNSIVERFRNSTTHARGASTASAIDFIKNPVVQSEDKRSRKPPRTNMSKDCVLALQSIKADMIKATKTYVADSCHKLNVLAATKTQIGDVKKIIAGHKRSTHALPSKSSRNTRSMPQ